MYELVDKFDGFGEDWNATKEEVCLPNVFEIRLLHLENAVWTS